MTSSKIVVKDGYRRKKDVLLSEISRIDKQAKERLFYMVEQERDRKNKEELEFYGVFQSTRYGVEIFLFGCAYVVGFNTINSRTLYC